MKNKKLTILLIITFAVGMFFASGIGFLYVSGKLPVVSQAKQFTKKVFFKIKDIRFNSVQKAKEEFIICDFEGPDDSKKWKLVNSQIELSKEHSARGLFSGKVSFGVGQDVSAVKLDDYIQGNAVLKNLAPYQSISFDIFNPQKNKERIIVQVKDRKGRKFKGDIFIAGNSFGGGEIEIAPLRHILDIYNIADITFFLWQPAQKKIFYIDNVRLLPYSNKKEGPSLISASAETPETAYAAGDYFDFSRNKNKWLKEDGAAEKFIEFPFYLVNGTGLKQPDLPFSGGIPFPRGELKDISVIGILNSQGQSMDFQAKPLCLWQDGSIKWLLVDFKSSLEANSEEVFKMRYSMRKKTGNNSALKTEESANLITVFTGPLKFTVKKNNFNFLNEGWLDKNNDTVFQDEELIIRNSDLSLGFRGDTFRSSQDKDSRVTVEDKGPVKVTLRAEGWFKNDRGDRFCKYIVRIHAFAGESYLRVSHTFIYTGYPENKYHYLYEGRRLPGNETVDFVSISLPFNLSGENTLSFAADNNLVRERLSGNTGIFQDNFNKFNIEKAGAGAGSGQKLGGWVDISDTEKGFSFGIKNLWQQFPKEYYVDNDSKRLVVSLWPKKAGALDFKTTASAHGPEAVARGSAFGVAKTHELALYFHQGNFTAVEAQNTISGLMRPLLIQASPRWINDTAAIGKILPYDQRLLPAENMLEGLFDWGQRQIKDFNWYGMVDFGDTLSWYRKESYDKSYDEWGWHPEGRWGWFNCEAAGTHTGALLQYLRTGKEKYFHFGENLARHIMDIDTCHYNTVVNDKRLKGVIPEDYSQPGSMHRHNGNHWGGRNEEASHTNLTGILLYYYITGNERAFEVAKEVGEFFLKEPITYFRHPDIAPHRGIANILWGEVLLYEATRDERFKKAADKWAGIFYNGQQNNGAWAENYNPKEKRWDGDPAVSFMSGHTLPALIEYHKLTLNKEIKNCILKAADYLIKNDKYGHAFDAIAYSFWLTGDKKFKDEGLRRLEYLISSQKNSDNLMMNGMIYNKAYYARVSDFLYRAPFILGVLADEK